MGPDVATRLQRAGQTTDAEVAEAEAIRRAFRAEVDAALSQCDVLALPTLASPPPRLEDAADTSAAVSMTALVRPSTFPATRPSRCRWTTPAACPWACSWWPATATNGSAPWLAP
jgi:Asp-tRNA(Asn)/Glu-tRNA(Gln) amidotransferase A subunit family amidase